MSERDVGLLGEQNVGRSQTASTSALLVASFCDIGVGVE
jgi:hypothetical protein